MYAGNENSSLVREWVECAIRMGHEVLWASMHPPSDNEYAVCGEDVRVAFSPVNKGLWDWVKILRGFKKIANNFKPDVVHAHYLADYGYLASQLKYPTICEVMGSDVAEEHMTKGQQLRITSAAKSLTRVSVKDEFAKTRLMQLGAKQENIIIRPSFCDTKFFNRDFNILRKEQSILYARKWREDNKYKTDVLVNGISRLCTEIPKIKIYLVDWPGNIIDLKDNVVLLPRLNREQMREHLNMASIYLDTYYRTPSAGIGHGTTTIEAMACGCTLVLPDRKEYLDGRFYGVCYKQGDTNELVDAVKLLIDKPFLVNHYGASNRISAVENFDREKIMNKMFKLYEELI